MRVHKGPDELLPGESFLSIAPEPDELVDAGWLRRANLFAGRAVSDGALSGDQAEHRGRLALQAQGLSAGVLCGLELALEWDAGDVGPAAFVHIQPGVGVTRTGEDIRLIRPLRVDLRDLVVGTGEVTLGNLISDLASAPATGFVLLLEPVEIPRLEASDDQDSCERDPGARSFAQHSLVDGVRLRLAPWPVIDLGSVEASPRLRNQLAYRLFSLEQLRPVGQVQSFEASGLPMAVLGLTGGGEIFLDSHSLARQGGLGASRRPLVGGTGTPTLWQARFEQFADQMAATPIERLRSEGLRGAFRWLPPVGALPAGLVAVREGMVPLAGDPDPVAQLFPPAFHLEALPIRLEALEQVMRASCALAPFDLDGAEQLQLLVPVPQADFEPGLLVLEPVDGLFQETLDLFRRRLDDRKARQSLVNRARRRFGQRLDGEPTPEDGDPPVEVPDPGDLGGAEIDPETFDGNYVDGIDDLFGNLVDDCMREVGESALIRVLEILRLDGVSLPSTSNARDQAVTTSFGGLGLTAFLTQVAALAERADERLDLAFTKARTALYRIRHQVAGETEVTQMATSPVLNELAKGRFLAADGRRWNEFKAALAAREETSTPPPDDGGAGDGGGSRRSGRAVLVGARAAHERVSGGAFTAALASSRVFEADLDVEADRIFVHPDRIRDTLDFEAVPKEDRLKLLIDKYAYRPSASVWFETPPLTRLLPPPAVERKVFALEVKIDVLRTIVAIHESGVDLSGLQFPGFVDARKPETRDIAGVQTALDGLGDDGYGDFDDRDDGDDEAAVFNTGVRSLEHAVASLRLVEQRISAFNRLVDLGRKRLDSLEKERDRVEARLSELADEIAEMRHDVQVAEALLDEETERVAGVNARRDAVVREQVPFLVFRRPCTVDTSDDEVPECELEPGLLPDPVPDCLSVEYEAPDQLRAMVDLFREAPVKWFAAVAELLRPINRLPTLHGLLHSSVLQARLAMPQPHAPFQLASITQPSLGQRLSKVFSGRLASLQALRAARANFDMNRVKTAGWIDGRRQAEEILTLEDLLSGRHGRQDARARAVKLLEEIYRIAACVYARFREVPADLRLVWAERISAFDDPVALRDLASLPRWREIDRLDRHELQALVDWLYQQLDPKQVEAVAMMHELVRVCLLLASHAPVARIIEENVLEPDAPVSPGGLVRVKLDPAKVRIGMHVALFDKHRQSVGRGLVYDIGDRLCQIRVVKTIQPVVRADRVEISEPSLTGELKLASGGVGSFGVAGLGGVMLG